MYVKKGTKNVPKFPLAEFVKWNGEADDYDDEEEKRNYMVHERIETNK